MPNPFYSRFGPKPQAQQPQFQNGPFGNMNKLLNMYEQFKMSFQGDPEQQVQYLLSSGQMSQEQFQKFSNWAEQFRRLFR